MSAPTIIIIEFGIEQEIGIFDTITIIEQKVGTVTIGAGITIIIETGTGTTGQPPASMRSRRSACRGDARAEVFKWREISHLDREGQMGRLPTCPDAGPVLPSAELARAGQQDNHGFRARSGRLAITLPGLAERPHNHASGAFKSCPRAAFAGVML